MLGEHITPWTLGEALRRDELTGHYAVCRGIVVALEMVALGFGLTRAREGERGGGLGLLVVFFGFFLTDFPLGVLFLPLI